MSGIKSDEWIRQQCKNNLWLEEKDDKTIKHITSRFFNGRNVRPATVSEIIKYNETSVYKLKVPMIEPFEPEQVRTRTDEISSINPPRDGRYLSDYQLVDGDPTIRRRTEKIISYGTSSYGYDIRCAPEFKVFTNVNTTIVDPKNFNEKSFVDITGDYCIIPPNSFALARSIEYMRIPRDILVICLGKSTYARVGITVNVTPLEPEWEGHITLEFSNTTPLPVKIYANEGCAQLLFLQADEDDVCKTSYYDRAGKYQGQMGITLPRG